MANPALFEELAYFRGTIALSPVSMVHTKTPRIPEQVDKTPVEGAVRRVVERKIIHVQREGPVGILPNELPNLVHIAGLAVGRHPHDFVFSLVDFEAQERGERAV